MNAMTRNFAMAGLALAAASAGRAQPTAGASKAGEDYRLERTLHVGGEGGFDFLTVDPERKLLFVPRSTHTMVLEAATGKLVADIPGQQHNHGVALVPGAGRGFISDGKDASVVIFDLKTFDVLGKIKADVDADSVIYDSASDKVLVACGDAGVLIAIAPGVDPKAGKADATLPLGGKPEFLAADGKGKAYVNLENKNQVAVVDTKAMKVVDRWPTAPGGAPVGMAMDTERRRLFVGCRTPPKMVVMSADDGKVLADLPIGVGVDATAFDGDAFASCRDGSLAVARETSPGKFEIVLTVATRQGAKTMALDPTTHTIYLPTADFGAAKAGQARPAAAPDSFMVLVVGRSAK